MDDLGINDEVVKIKLGDNEYPIDFTMASIYYLTEKYGDIIAIFSSLGKGLDSKSLDIVCDLIYAGILKCDDKDNFFSPISTRQIMAKIHLRDIDAIKESVTKAFSSAFPDVKENPTKAGKRPAKQNGIGDTSILPEQSI